MRRSRQGSNLSDTLCGCAAEACAKFRARGSLAQDFGSCVDDTSGAIGGHGLMASQVPRGDHKASRRPETNRIRTAATGLSSRPPQPQQEFLQWFTMLAGDLGGLVRRSDEMRRAFPRSFLKIRLDKFKAALTARDGRRRR